MWMLLLLLDVGVVGRCEPCDDDDDDDDDSDDSAAFTFAAPPPSRRVIPIRIRPKEPEVAVPDVAQPDEAAAETGLEGEDTGVDDG